jgi:hypothetical protein
VTLANLAPIAFLFFFSFTSVCLIAVLQPDLAQWEYNMGAGFIILGAIACVLCVFIGNT